jgi:TolB-like protein
MGCSFASIEGTTIDSGERLQGWKAIARILGRDVRTVQLWERDRALPIHRIPGQAHGSVFAYKAALDAWLGGGALVASPPAAFAADHAVPALLVMPFDYLAPDDAMAFVGEALAAQIIGRLSAVSPLQVRVLSWTTARACAAQRLTAAKLGAQFGVRYLLEGVVLAAGATWQIDVRLVDVQSEQVVFADRFACGRRDVMTLQAQVVDAVCAQLALVRAGVPLEPFWNERVDPAAFLCFLQAVEGYEQHSVASVDRAAERVEEAIRIDRAFLPALPLRVRVWLRQRSQSALTPEGAARLHSERKRCTGLAPDLLQTRLMNAMVAQFVTYEWDEVHAQLTPMVAALPADITVRSMLGFNHSMRREFAQAQTVLAPMLGLDTSANTYNFLGTERLAHRDYDGALRMYDQALAQSPDGLYSHLKKTLTVGVYQQRFAEARDQIRVMPAGVRDHYGDLFAACIAAAEGDHATAQAARERVIAQTQAGMASWFHVACIDGLSGDAAACAHHLAMARDVGDNRVSIAAIEPCLDPVRGDPAMKEMFRSMRLPE